MIDYPHWLDGQGVLASLFMLPALYRLFYKDGSLLFRVLIVAWAVHAIGGAEFFAERLAAMPRPHATFTEIGTTLMLLAKATIVWAGEKGRGWIWTLFLSASALWATMALLL